MPNLDDPIWKQLEGGYKTPYDVSIPLKKLGKSNDSKEIQQLWIELWE